jgi:biopolymer transport protein ExbB
MRLPAAPARTQSAAVLLTLLAAALLLAVFFGCPAVARADDGGGAGDFFDMIGFIFSKVPLIFAVVLLAISVSLVALIVLLFMDLRMSAAVPPGFIEEFSDTINKRQFKQAYEMAKTDSSFLGRVMTAGMARLQYGIDDAREAAFNMVENIKSGKDTFIAYLATIGTLGPLIGLVGTVWGMIGAFRVLSSTPRFEMLAGRIAEALILTLLGIALSVPAIVMHTFFRNRLTRLSMETATISDDLLTQMYHNSKKPAAAPAAGAAAAAAPAPAHDPAAAADARIPSAGARQK